MALARASATTAEGEKDGGGRGEKKKKRKKMRAGRPWRTPALTIFTPSSSSLPISWTETGERGVKKVAPGRNRGALRPVHTTLMGFVRARLMTYGRKCDEEKKRGEVEKGKVRLSATASECLPVTLTHGSPSHLNLAVTGTYR